MGRIEELVGAPNTVPYRFRQEHGGLHGEHGIYATWENFKMQTTAHGVPHIHHARGTGKRCFWVFITLACLTGLAYNTYSITNRFFSYQVSTSQTMSYQSSLTFPAVTVCNNNPVLKSMCLNDSTLNDLIYDDSSSWNRASSSNWSAASTNTSNWSASSTNTSNWSAASTNTSKSTGITGVTNSSLNSTTATTIVDPKSTLSTQQPTSTSTKSSTSLAQQMGPTTTATTTTRNGPSANNAGMNNPSGSSSSSDTMNGNVTSNSSAKDSPPPVNHCSSSPSSTSYNSFGMNRPAGQSPGFATNGFSPNGLPQRTDFQLKLRVQQELSQMTDEKREELGHQISDLIVDCEYAGSTCYPATDFVQFYSALYGNCFVFNSGWNVSVKKQISTKPGPRYGLSLTFNVDQDEYIGEITESAGMRVVVHDAYRMPFPEDEGVAVAPGLLTYVGTRMTNIARLGNQYSNCTDPTSLNVTRNVYESLHPVGYSQTACYNTCYQRNVILTCKCFDSSYPPLNLTQVTTTILACNVLNSTQTTCTNNVTTQFQNNNLDCACPLACSETRYDTRTSSHIWPSVDYTDTVWNTLATTNSKVAAILNQNCDTSKYAKNLGKMVIYLEDFSYASIEESPDYGIWTFLSDFGGILGLYIGFSIFTIVECIELALDITVLGFVKLYRDQSVKNKINHIDVNEKKIKPYDTTPSMVSLQSLQHPTPQYIE